MKRNILTLLRGSLILLLFIQTQESSGALSPRLVLQHRASAKIPIDPKRWYQVNNVSAGLDGLFDGVTTESVNTGWGKILTNFDAYYPLLDGEQLSIESIRLYDGAGTNTDKPVTLSIITDQWSAFRLPALSVINTRLGWVPILTNPMYLT
ncbi:hypothetical protein [Spirosoma telluris]|uniref:hypothetical protein n=1 Tax=Spirosoma telluris TaxID=2183553 RepID=UPI002FC3868F